MSSYQDMAWEAEITRRGHWHPLSVPCSQRPSCPMGDPLTRDLFRREIDRAQASLSKTRRSKELYS
jgi:hypothetical protein